MWLAWEVNTWMSGEREGTLDGRAGPGRELGVLWNVDDFMERRWPKAPSVRAGPTRRQEPAAIRPRRSGLGDQTSAIRPAQATAGMPNRQRDRHPRPWLTRDAAVPLTVTWFSLPSGEGLRCRSIDHPCLLPAPGPQPGPAPSGRPHPYPSLPAKPCQVLPVPSCRDTSWFP